MYDAVRRSVDYKGASKLLLVRARVCGCWYLIPKYDALPVSECTVRITHNSSRDLAHAHQSHSEQELPP